MKVRGMLCAMLAGGCLAAMAVPTAVGETGCGPGYEEGVSEEYDTDGDGMVCVNQETGAVSDDQGGIEPGARDRTNDGIVCVKATGGGSVVVTDNNSNHPENGNCPPSFSPAPI